jgi:hypothetical protein
MRLCLVLWWGRRFPPANPSEARTSSWSASRLNGVAIASKTGALDALRSEVALVYAKGGRIAMAITIDGMLKIDYTPDNAGSILIADMARILVDGLARR